MLTEENRKSAIKLFAQNEVNIEPLYLNESSLEKIRTSLKTDKNIKMLLAYASTYDILAEYLSEKNDIPDMFGVRGIISSSEILYDSTRSKLKKVFGCPVVSRYSNQENGVLAQECRHEKGFHVNTASYYIELLDLYSDKPAKSGEPARIIVTDLFNYAMPMIRYDTGDIGVIGNEKCKCKLNTPIICSVEGRKVDIIYNTKGKRISPFAVSNHLCCISNVNQFQFIQNDQKKYTIKLCVSNNFEGQNETIRLLKEIVGTDAQIAIEYADEIPVLASGKRRYIICNYEPHKN